MSSRLKELDEEKKKSRLWMGIGIAFMIIGVILLGIVIFLLTRKPKVVTKVKDTLKQLSDRLDGHRKGLIEANTELAGLLSLTSAISNEPLKMPNNCAPDQCPPSGCRTSEGLSGLNRSRGLNSSRRGGLASSGAARRVSFAN